MDACSYNLWIRRIFNFFGQMHWFIEWCKPNLILDLSSERMFFVLLIEAPEIEKDSSLIYKNF